MIDVCLLGCGGVMPLPGRFLTSFYVRHDGSAALIDCGEGTQIALRQAAMKYSRIDTILFTHLHADHISGIVGFLLTLGLEGRTEPLTIYGPMGVTRAVNAMLIIGPALPFELIFREFTEDTVEFSEIGMKITAFKAKHSVECYGYHFQLDRAPKFDVEKAKALGVPVKYWSILQKGESVEGYAPADVLGEPRKGLSLLYATDTRPVEAISNFGKDADLLVLEGMYGDQENLEKAEIAGHMTMQEAANIAVGCNAKKLWLTHYSPAVEDPMVYESDIMLIFPETTMGHDGLAETLKFE